MGVLATYRIGDIGRVVTGKTPPTADVGNFGAEFPFLTPTDMQGTKWARRTERGISTAGALKLRSQVPARSVAVSCIGWQMGKAILTDRPTYTNQQINTIIPNKVADAEYLFYYFATRREELLSIGSAGGVRTPIISKSSFEAIKIDLPHVVVQRRIASILSAYDDLIENNTLRIAILEEMAHRIYEEWFVRFRFPNRRKVSMVDSKLGPVPRGWTVGALSDIAVLITRGIAPKYDDDANGLVINQKCIRGQQLNLAEARRQSKYVPTEKIVQQGDVLINSTGVGTLGRVAQILREIADCTVDTHVTIVRRAQGCDPEFLGLALLYRQPYFEAQGVGSTGQTELSRSRIAETLLVIPPAAVQQQFGRVVGPIRLLAAELQAKNDILRATRDLLLPKLISGELDVSSLTQLEAAVA